MSKPNLHIDEALILRIKSGDRTALTALVKRWHKEFCEKAYWLTKDKELSKDIAQDSWKIIMEKIVDLKEPRSFKSWAFKIIFSKSYDALRMRQKISMELQSYAFSKNEQEDEPIDNSDLKRQLLIEVEKLWKEQQIVLRLFYVEAYCLREIAELLEISVGTAKSRLFHAREKLKSILKK